MGETGLFYCLAFDKTIARRQVEGPKKSKTRVTAALTCNADGSDKREPFVIGHAKKPRCFQKKTAGQLGFNYRSDTKAGMTGVLFQEWLRELDEDTSAQRRKVVLLLDNTSAHSVNNVDLRSVTVVFLPPNTTAKLQPMDAGVIASLKRHYRHRQRQHALSVDEQGTQNNIDMVDQLTAMKWIKSCWREVPNEAVLNCFRAAEHKPAVTNAAAAHPRPMDLEDFICCAAEAKTKMEAFTAAELLSDDVDGEFLCTTEETNEDDESAEPEPTHEAASSADISTEGKVDAVRTVVFLQSDHPDLERLVLGELSALQQRQLGELRREKENVLTQTLLRGFFVATSTAQ